MAFLQDFEKDSLIVKTAEYVKDFMSQFDASHDWQHIVRVVSLARTIFDGLLPTSALNNGSSQDMSLRKVILAALLHDVADTKYIPSNQQNPQFIANLLTDHGADEQLADDIQSICHGVSYRTEVKDLAAAQALLQKHPELAIVQDADRLDAIGAVGVGRCFTYGGAKTTRSLDGSIDHFDKKLLHLEKMMKTTVGTEMARVRTERLRLFKKWWDDEKSIIADS